MPFRQQHVIKRQCCVWVLKNIPINQLLPHLIWTNGIIHCNFLTSWRISEPLFFVQQWVHLRQMKHKLLSGVENFQDDKSNPWWIIPLEWIEGPIGFRRGSTWSINFRQRQLTYSHKSNDTLRWKWSLTIYKCFFLVVTTDFTTLNASQWDPHGPKCIDNGPRVFKMYNSKLANENGQMAGN